MASPITFTDPDVGDLINPRTESNVDFPDPDLPMTAEDVPAWNETFTWSRAVTVPPGSG